MVLRMAVVLSIVAAAILLDVYFGNNPAELENIQAESQEHSSETGGIYLIAQTNPTNAKTSAQKSITRKLPVQLHDKFLRKYHQVRNYQVLKAEVQSQTAPIIQSYHYLVFQNYFFSQPDEDAMA